MARRIIVDDTSDRIIYSQDSAWGDSGVVQPNYNTLNFGPPYGGGVHATSASTLLWFAFSGTSVEVNGYNDVSQSADWTCTVDGTPIDGKSKMPFDNGLTFCQQPNLPDGPHNLTVQIYRIKNRWFWFDHIQYTPSPNANLKDKAFIYQNDDQDLKYGPGWNTADGTTKTNQTGSTVELEFNGTAISAFSRLPAEFFESNSMPGSYSLDGNSSKSFDQSGHLNLDKASYNQQLFQSSTFAPGIHKLTVTYLGDTDHNPLFLDYLIVENYPTAYAAAAAAAAADAKAAADAAAANAKAAADAAAANAQAAADAAVHAKAAKAARIKAGTIAGAVLGGLALLWLLYLCRSVIGRAIRNLCSGRTRSTTANLDEWDDAEKPPAYQPARRS
ncbi:hypothetical protein CPB83DRAFT_840117 [Crepidotus variabilis]|uniref:Uncharacterized protein n=1 Tax=Crepidotus variabilis TaxID=179855 RepID=A0A9P6E5G6_9AGAR|nr:hypothetical protein CPB83DRAFT_840117 [Crepidotus variabilis]